MTVCYLVALFVEIYYSLTVGHVQRHSNLLIDQHSLCLIFGKNSSVTLKWYLLQKYVLPTIKNCNLLIIA